MVHHNFSIYFTFLNRMAKWKQYIDMYIMFANSQNCNVPKDLAEIICAKADINSIPNNTSTPLELSILNDRADITTELLHLKADPNIKTSRDESLLEFTALCGSKKLQYMKLLLEHKANPNEFGRFNPLYLSVLTGSPDMVSMLIEAGTNQKQVVIRGPCNSRQKECLLIINNAVNKLRRQWAQVFLRGELQLFQICPGLIRYLGKKLLLFC